MWDLQYDKLYYTPLISAICVSLSAKGLRPLKHQGNDNLILIM